MSERLPFLFYIAGSLFFLGGSILSLIRMRP